MESRIQRGGGFSAMKSAIMLATAMALVSNSDFNGSLFSGGNYGEGQPVYKPKHTKKKGYRK